MASAVKQLQRSGRVFLLLSGSFSLLSVYVSRSFSCTIYSCETGLRS